MLYVVLYVVISSFISINYFLSGDKSPPPPPPKKRRKI